MNLSVLIIFIVLFPLFIPLTITSRESITTKDEYSISKGDKLIYDVTVNGNINYFAFQLPNRSYIEMKNATMLICHVIEVSKPERKNITIQLTLKEKNDQIISPIYYQTLQLNLRTNASIPRLITPAFNNKTDAMSYFSSVPHIFTINDTLIRISYQFKQAFYPFTSENTTYYYNWHTGLLIYYKDEYNTQSTLKDFQLKINKLVHNQGNDIALQISTGLLIALSIMITGVLIVEYKSYTLIKNNSTNEVKFTNYFRNKIKSLKSRKKRRKKNIQHVLEKIEDIIDEGEERK